MCVSCIRVDFKQELIQTGPRVLQESQMPPADAAQKSVTGKQQD